MTAPNSSSYPIPADWQNFERLCITLMSEIYGCKFQAYGRSGQRQNGVDAFGILANGDVIAVQCKGRDQGYGSRLKPKDIHTAVRETNNFNNKIAHFYILSTCPNDVVLENEAMQITQSNVLQGRFPVTFWGWQTLENQIRRYESVQREHFGYWFKRPSTLQWAMRIAIGCLIIIGSIYAVHQYLTYQNAQVDLRESTDKDISQFLTLTNKLDHAYSTCLKALDEKPFLSSWELDTFCAKPVSISLGEIESQVKETGLNIDARAFDNLSAILKILREDYRQVLIASDRTRFFEKNVLHDMKALCPPFKDKGMMDRMFIELREPAESAQISQLNFYFLLRDFIMPSLNAVKAQVIVSTRQINNQQIPQTLMKEAQELNQLISERNNYNIKPPQVPFSLAVVKSMSSREITMTGEMPDQVEDARWANLMFESLTFAMEGNPKEVDELVRCGLYKPETPDIIKKRNQEKILKSQAQ
ncbi:hypothetical protein PO816_004048 [Cronobacter dublinensis]|nr:hypothetical protein [Cronobacter dublinensis]